VIAVKRQTLKSKVKSKINRSRRLVFMRSDFEKLGGYDQVGRALNALKKDGCLIKIGYGLYSKARTNRLTGQPMLDADGGFVQVVEEALNRLKVNWDVSDSVSSYQNGSTQIPANAKVIIRDRFSRQIATDRHSLQVA
jgi:hypothetical protein